VRRRTRPRASYRRGDERWDFALPFAHGLGAVVDGGAIASFARGFQIAPDGGT
jgi:hypothetical protein